MFDRCMQTRCREDPVLPYPLVHRRQRLMRFYATTLFSLFQSGLILREIRLRRIFTIAEPKTMRAGMSACQHRFSSSLPYEHPPAAALFFPFREGRPRQDVGSRQSISQIPPRPVRPILRKKERDLPDKTRISGTFTKTAKLFCAKTTKGKSRN